MLSVVVAVVSTAAGFPMTSEVAPSVEASDAARAAYLLDSSAVHDDPTVLWPGFLNGLRGFENFYNPVGNPLYFETPLNNTEVRLLYLHHEFDENSALAGGDLNVVAAQIRLALTERLGFIATKDGYSWLDADALPDGEGWNDLAFGFKYVFLADAAQDFLLTAGARYQTEVGEEEVLQGGVQELSPFVSAAKGWGDFHLMGNFSYRIPLDSPDGNNVAQWSLHADYEVFRGIAPMVELHGVHYLDDAERTPLPVGGLDYTNLGSTMVDGSDVVWLGLGAGLKLTPHAALGAAYEFALTDAEDDIMDERITCSLHLTW